MAGAADGNAGSEIQEPIAINVPDFDTAPMRHHERVLARIRGRYYFGIAGQECPRFRSWQFSSDGGMALLVHALTFWSDGRGIFPPSTCITCMGDFGSLVQVAKDAQLVRGRRRNNVDGVGNCQWPACGRADSVHTDILIAGDESELLQPGRWFEQA